jgi:hypothetical protein
MTMLDVVVEFLVVAREFHGRQPNAALAVTCPPG